MENVLKKLWLKVKGAYKRLVVVPVLVEKQEAKESVQTPKHDNKQALSRHWRF